ncbi:MAG: PAS domain-containing protein [Balneolaceae bacterium]|nr:PAS domain-containing protein [Balneolaceae bacterium]MCH8547441.1 LuxR C-terminal-related transcriptional regulator [Balneolaceae bacterium]
MKWIKDNIDYLKNSNLNIDDPEAEERKAIDLIKKFRPIGNQCVYALSYFNEKVLYLSDSVQEIFGYPPDKIKHVDFFYGLIHPDDRERVKEITIQALQAGANEYGLKPDHVFHIIYRMKNKDGVYRKIQRQTGVLTHDSDKNLLTSFGIFTDVSHLNSSREIQSFMTGPKIPGYRFLDPHGVQKVDFTKREREIIELLAKGLNSDEISEKLYISPKTVYTHRQNIIKKAGVKNTAQLMSYMFKNGY